MFLHFCCVHKMTCKCTSKIKNPSVVVFVAQSGLRVFLPSAFGLASWQGHLAFASTTSSPHTMEQHEKQRNEMERNRMENMKAGQL
jgi:hypothetical protein